MADTFDEPRTGISDFTHYNYVSVSNILQNLTGSAANSFSYDAVGNLTQDNQLTYA